MNFLATAKNTYPHLRKNKAGAALHTLSSKSAARLSVNSTVSLSRLVLWLYGHRGSLVKRIPLPTTPLNYKEEKTE